MEETYVTLGLYIFSALAIGVTGFIFTYRVHKSAKRKEMMFEMMFHEISNLLTTAKWDTEMIMSNQHGKPNLSHLELLDKINHGVDDAMSVISSYHDASGFNSNENLHIPTDVNPRDAIAKMLEDMKKKQK